MNKGCSGYKALLIGDEQERPRLEDIPIIRKYLYVFPDELLGHPSAREVEFLIDLMPGIAPISKIPCRMAPTKLKELKE